MNEYVRIGGSIKKELVDGYYGAIGRDLSSVSIGNLSNIESGDEVIKALNKTSGSMCHMLSYDLGGKGLVGAVKGVGKNEISKLLRDQVKGVNELIHKKITPRFGLAQLLFVPFLESEGVEAIE